jgi:alkaline ceramidase
VSNIFFFLVPPIMIILFQPYSKRVANGIMVLWVLVIVIGIGSIYFHSTLSLVSSSETVEYQSRICLPLQVGELADEISILWVLTAGYALFLPGVYLPQSFRVQRYAYLLVMPF